MTLSDQGRNVVLYQLLSLDGVAEEPGNWMFDDGPDIVDNLARTISTQDDVLLGRGTYDYWVGYWPTSDFEPFATFINTVHKHVISSSDPADKWSNSTYVNAPVADYVAALKGQPGREIGIHGSIRLARFMLRSRLVDELRLVVAPTLAGHGQRLFADDDTLDRLELIDVERSPKGTLFLHYCRRGMSPAM